MCRPVRPLILLIICLWLYTSQAHALLDNVQVTNLSDMNLPTWNLGDPAVTASIDVCVYAIHVLSSATYSVTISSPDGFVLKSGTQQIPFTLYWNDGGAGNLNSGLGTQIFNNTQLPNRNNANILSVLCAAGVTGPTARLTLKIAQPDMAAALSGTYSGTLTIMLSAN